MEGFNEWWITMTFAEQLFWLLGFSGTTLLILQTVLGMLGADADVDFDVDTEISLDFGVFSVKSVIAFITFFGWMGVIGLGRGWSLPLTILAAAGAGLVAMFLVAYMLFQFQKLESSGTMEFSDALLQEGEVYLAIPAAGIGQGQVSVEVNGQVRELTAVTSGGAIPTGARIKVVDILEENLLLVEALPELPSAEEFLKLENE